MCQLCQLGSAGGGRLGVATGLTMDFRVWPHPKNRTEKKGAGLIYLAQPKADWGQTWPSLASSWDEQELTCAQLWAFKLGHRGQLAPTWAQLEPNWGPTWRNLGMFGRKLGLACATWSCVGASGAEVGPKTSPLWATRARANPHQSQTTLEIGAILSVSLAAKLPRLGTFGAGGLQIMRYLQ